MVGKKIVEEDGIDIDIKKYIEGEGITNIPPASRRKVLEKELAKPHLIYDNIALTDNYLIAMDAKASPNGTFTGIKYDDLVWLYIGETSGNFIDSANYSRIISLADGGSKEEASRSAKYGVVDSTVRSFVDIVMLGTTRGTTYNSIMVAFSKDRTAIVAVDSRSRMFTKRHSGNFRNLLETIIERAPSDLMVGAKYEDEFCEMMGIETYKTDSSFGYSPDEDGDGGDELL